MRPLDKGKTPTNDNNEVKVNEYAEWRAHLISRIGYYCVYCNIPLSHSLNVEHVVPKVPQMGQAAGEYLAWENMLLSCGPCNSAKGNKPVDTDNLYLPEYNNTLLAFDVEVHPDNPNAARTVPKNGLNYLQRQRAENTINLLGLDQIDNRARVVDIRWKKRKAAILLAETAYSLYSQLKETAPNNLPKAAEYIARTAAESGFFGVWFKIFGLEPLVMERLLDTDIIPGTATECFHPDTYELKPRNPKNKEDQI
ncbi:HNH endonuclease [Parapedobacter sp. ISTM3]|uniref:HNH endonuclease n=1 Tax=Parapedobacter sp. ISTM3 TaxID=2800130 RepID=UPI001904996A|nr:HNH endonuclease [Parapedobacter sp. ISTM3]MBK1439827.1 HNH endonuclease [Parapedobacter sp. ISTM3]